MDEEVLDDQGPKSPDENGGGTRTPAEGATPNEELEKVKSERGQLQAQIDDLKKMAGVSTFRDLKAKIAPKPKDETKPTAPAATQGDQVLEHVKLMNQGYSEDEIAFIKRNADGRPLSEAAKDETIVAAVEGIRAKKKSAEVAPEPSSRTPIAGGKSFSELTPQDRQKNYNQTFDTLVSKARRQTRSLT